jgi:hypothetical protein
MKSLSIQIIQHGKVMDKFLDVAVFSIWITVFAVLAPKACDAEYENQQAKTERFLAK